MAIPFIFLTVKGDCHTVCGLVRNDTYKYDI